MTLQTYLSFRGRLQNETSSSLIMKWIKRLSLEDEPIKIIHEHKNGYAGITLRFNNEINSWVISENGLSDQWILHKLGYIWFWKKMGCLERQKTTWNDQSNLYCLASSSVMDNIVFYHFCNMDKDFYDFWIGYTTNELKYWYKGASWDKPYPDTIYRYITEYLNYFYVISGDIVQNNSNHIMQILLARRKEILEKAQERTNRGKKDFMILNKLLRSFDKILKSNNYRSIESYILKLQYFF